LDDFAQKQEFYISRDIVDIELLFIWLEWRKALKQEKTEIFSH
jgi:hypothetical protein